jgi:hypothetical protein
MMARAPTKGSSFFWARQDRLKESEAKVLALQNRGWVVLVEGVTNTVGDFFVNTMKNTYVFHVA